MNNQNLIKIVELKFNRLKTLLYFMIWPCVAVITLLISLAFTEEISGTVALIGILYVAVLYALLLIWFAKRTDILIAKLGGKK